MNNSEWRQKIYGPYADFWKVLRIIQHGLNKVKDDPKLEADNDALWDRYAKAAEEYCEAYKNNSFAEDLGKMLYKYDDIIAKINQKEYEEDNKHGQRGNN